MRIALVHDWLTGVRGGERVLDVVARALPDAEIHTLFHVPGSTTPAIESRPIHTSPLDRVPGARHAHRALLPLYPWAVRRLDVGDVDVVLSTSHAVAKAVRVPKGAVHLSYCFTPMRYVWDQIDSYLGHGWKRRLSSPLVERLRAFDVATSGPDQVDRFLAISTSVSRRILETYGREARVLAPPVDCNRFKPQAAPPCDAYLLVSGFVPYKADALAVEAFARSGRPLIVAGDGPLRTRIERAAPAHVRFTGRVSDEELARLYANCRALVHPQEEDFGLIAVEAQAAGRPVVALGHGGALDTVRPLDTDPHEPTGVFFDTQTPDALNAALDRFEANERAFDPAAIRRHAETFGEARFVSALQDELDDLARKRSPEQRPTAGARQ